MDTSIKTSHDCMYPSRAKITASLHSTAINESKMTWTSIWDKAPVCNRNLACVPVVSWSLLLLLVISIEPDRTVQTVLTKACSTSYPSSLTKVFDSPSYHTRSLLHPPHVLLTEAPPYNDGSYSHLRSRLGGVGPVGEVGRVGNRYGRSTR